MGLSKLHRSLLALSISLILAGCQPEKEWIRNIATGPALGTSYSIIYLTKESLDVQQKIDSVFTVINQSMSTYMPESDISRINRGDTTIVVDEMFRDVFELSKEVHARTNGYFDPTVGVLVDAWGFGPGTAIELDSSRVDSLLNYVGFDKVNLTIDQKISKKHPEIRFDFNAVAKGYAIDRLGVMLDELELDHYLIEVGGELLAKGQNAQKNKQWVVGIDDPQYTEGRRLMRTIYLEDAAMASSGNYRKFRIDPESGEKYVHTIDPKTGFTKNSKVLSASVITDSCAKADAYATAFMALELEDAQAVLVKDPSLEAYIIYLNDIGEVQEFMTEGFKELLVL